jgi:hypothetical protein
MGRSPEEVVRGRTTYEETPHGFAKAKPGHAGAESGFTTNRDIMQTKGKLGPDGMNGECEVSSFKCEVRASDNHRSSLRNSTFPFQQASVKEQSQVQPTDNRWAQPTLREPTSAAKQSQTWGRWRIWEGMLRDCCFGGFHIGLFELVSSFDIRISSLHRWGGVRSGLTHEGWGV